ncbi:hypothetical protein HOH87_02305 [bacterium]|jgi:hypothetical protein|nr:hypothetical protein [bacterium]
MVLGNTTEKPPTPPPAQVASVVDGRVSPPLPGTDDSSNSGFTTPNIPPPQNATNIPPAPQVLIREEEIYVRKEVSDLVEENVESTLGSVSEQYKSDALTSLFIENVVIPSLTFKPKSSTGPKKCSSMKGFEAYCRKKTTESVNHHIQFLIRETIKQVQEIIDEFYPTEISQSDRYPIVVGKIKEGVEKQLPAELSSRFITRGHSKRHFDCLLPQMTAFLAPYTKPDPEETSH